MSTSLYRPVTLFWRISRLIVSFLVPGIINHRIIGSEIQVYDNEEEDYYPIGLNAGGFVVLDGSGSNYVIEDSVFKLLDVSDSQYYPVALEAGVFVVLPGLSDRNYKIDQGLFNLIDLSTQEYSGIILAGGAFSTVV